jgi:hypothetical protein
MVPDPLSYKAPFPEVVLESTVMPAVPLPAESVTVKVPLPLSSSDVPLGARTQRAHGEPLATVMVIAGLVPLPPPEYEATLWSV